MNAGPSGFDNAPVVKALFLTTTGSSILWQAAQLELLEPFNPAVDALVKTFVFQNTGELIFGMGLLYYFRILERQVGSAKFGGYATVVMTLSYSLQTAFRTAYNFRAFPTGPYGFLFACFLQFIFDIPPSRRFGLLGVPLSDKFFTYLMGLQLVLSRGTGSMMAALCGILAGFTYRSNIFRLRKFRFPSYINRLLARTVGRLLGSGPAHPIVTIHNPRPRHRRSNHTPNNDISHTPQQRARVAVSDEALQQLTTMGFDEAQARMALQATNNDVQSAIAMLLDQA